MYTPAREASRATDGRILYGRDLETRVVTNLVFEHDLDFRYHGSRRAPSPRCAATCQSVDSAPASKRGQVFSSFVISILVGSMASSAKREGAEVETPKSSSPKLARNASSKSSKKGLLASGSAGVSASGQVGRGLPACCLLVG